MYKNGSNFFSFRLVSFKYATTLTFRFVASLCIRFFYALCSLHVNVACGIMPTTSNLKLSMNGFRIESRASNTADFSDIVSRWTVSRKRPHSKSIVLTTSALCSATGICLLRKTIAGFLTQKGFRHMQNAFYADFEALEPMESTRVLKRNSG